MAKARIKLYPYVALDSQGEFSHVSAHAWETKDSVSTEYGQIIIGLPMIEVEVDYPDGEQLRAGALAVLQAERDKLNAEHHNTLTKFQMLENSLLRLAAPGGVEVLNPVQPRRPRDDMQQFGDDNHDSDIPF